MLEFLHKITKFYYLRITHLLYSKEVANRKIYITDSSTDLSPKTLLVCQLVPIPRYHPSNC